MTNNQPTLKISKKFTAFVENLSLKALETENVPFIGRKKEIEAVLETLLRKLKNNLLLVGKPGVGKTALITRIASMINEGSVHPALKDKIILEFYMTSFFYSRNTVEKLTEDLDQFFSEIRQHQGKIILFLNEMQMQSISGTPGKDPSSKILNILKSYISSRDLAIIAATTPENYYKFIKNDDILNLLFTPVLIDEPEENEMLKILAGVQEHFETYHGIRIPRSLFKKIVYFSQKFIPHRAFPQKAIDLLDISSTKASLQKKKELTIDYIYESVSELSNLPINIIKLDPRKQCEKIFPYLTARVVNQRKALEEISRIIKLFRLETHMNKTRPEGIFLFLGPTGVGKSFVSRKLAEFLFGDERKLRIIDLKQFKKSDDIKKLVETTPESTGMLTREVEAHPFSVILFENIDSAHSSVLSFLGKILNRGVLIDASGKKHFLSNIIFILSLTHIGIEKTESRIGFIQGEVPRRELIITPKIMNMLDWVDEIIEFTPLTGDHLSHIAMEKLKILKKELQKKYQITLSLNQKVARHISSLSLENGAYAHSVGEIIERQIRIKILDLVTKTSAGKKFSITVVNGNFRIQPEA